MGPKVTVAKTAGFCFGVKRAVDTVYAQVNSDEARRPIYTFGPIIHNEEVVRDLERCGVRVLADEAALDQVTEGTVVIRSHGVPRKILEKVREKELELVDATCPFVRKIHRIVEEKSREGYEIIIVGNASHPEVEGIRGWADGPVTVMESEEEAENFCPKADKPLCLVSQTTFNYKKFYKLVEILSKKGYDINVLNTICNATEERQTEARAIAKTVDAMIVIGGKHSSNTQKLYEICKKECENTYYIQTLVDLDVRSIRSMSCVGITAGASTPNKIIEEVSKQWVK